MGYDGKMKKEMEGILGREGTQPAIKDEDGKTRLVYNLFDGFTGRKVKLTIEEIIEEEETGEEEVGWSEAEGEAGKSWDYGETEAETETDEEEGEEEAEEAEQILSASEK